MNPDLDLNNWLESVDGCEHPADCNTTNNTLMQEDRVFMRLITRVYGIDRLYIMLVKTYKEAYSVRIQS
jgi:hypothetical protein